MLLGVFNGFNNFFETVGVQIIQCLAVFIIGVFAIRIIKSVIKKATNKSNNKTMISFFLSCLTVFLYVVIFYIIFSILGISTASFIAAISAAGLAIALSLKDSLSNLANGVLIVSTKPFVEGDYIKVNNVEGTVKSVKMFSTKILTVDNKEIILPNSKIVSSEIVNYSSRTTRRVDLSIYVAYGSDIEKVKEVLMNVMKNHKLIAKNPEPFARLNSYSENALIFAARAWTSNDNYWDCYHDLLEQFNIALINNGISVVPNSRQEIVVSNNETIQYDDIESSKKIDEVVND